MKVGILTFHMSFNHGAMLQAYALSKKLNLMGCDAEIIDFRLPHIDRYHHKDFFNDLVKKYGFIGVLKFLKRKLNHYYDSPSWNRFYSFMINDLPLSSQVVEDELVHLDYDCYITGSDQVWNENLTGGIQRCYFLDFVSQNSKRIAYAASSGSSDFHNADITQVKQWLNRLDRIGIRENGLCKYINDKLGIVAEQVVDPTLLLPKEEWIKLVHNVHYSDYVLIYTFEEKPYIYDNALLYAKRNNLKVISLAYEHKDLPDTIIQVTDAGPKEFLSYIYNAKAVFTSSFHGSVFSLIFEKQFYCFPHPFYHERTDSLLELGNLQGRNVYEGSFYTEDEIDYIKVKSLLEKNIKVSEKFLESIIT